MCAARQTLKVFYRAFIEKGLNVLFSLYFKSIYKFVKTTFLCYEGVLRPLILTADLPPVPSAAGLLYYGLALERFSCGSEETMLIGLQSVDKD